MSVELTTLKGDEDFCDIEVMAPDFDKEWFWMWDQFGDGRIDLSREQMRELRDWMNEEEL